MDPPKRRYRVKGELVEEVFIYQYERDIVRPLQAQKGDLLKPFESAEEMQTIQQRLVTELALLGDSVKAIRDPDTYLVEFGPVQK